MKIGIYSYFGYPLSFEERLNTIRDAGFEITSIGLGEEEEFVRKGDRDAMPGLARSKGLFIEYAHAPEENCNYLWSGSEGERAATEPRSSPFERARPPSGLAVDAGQTRPAGPLHRMRQSPSSAPRDRGASHRRNG